MFPVVSGFRRPPSPHRILTRHFLRCFLENDLMSPEADRAQMLAVTGSVLVSSTIFISVVMAFMKYVIGYYTPGQLAVSALDDRFFYIGLSMIVLALIAAAQWDALVVDVRDASILEPLPVQSGTIRRAKLAAVAIMGTAAALALNIIPSVVFPLLMLVNQSTSVRAMGWLMVAHLGITLLAGVFAYLAVIAFRETLAAVLGPRWFPRVSPWAQGALIVVVGSSLLLLPPTAVRVERTLRTVDTGTPPMWFLGAYEVVTRGILVDGERQALLSPRMRRADAVFSANFRRHEQKFDELAGRAAMNLAFVALIAAAAYAWNTRRLPALAPAPARDRRRRWEPVRAAVHALVTREAATRAGFFFTLAAIARSRTHRLTLACSAAVGLAMAVVALSRIDLAEIAAAGTMPGRFLSVQPLVIGALLVGFRHAIRVPAELRATWGFELAWRGRERQFLSGVKRAAICAIVLPALIVTLPLFVFVLGAPLALAHAALGLAGAVVLLEVLLAGYDKVPFTCTYLPNENIKLMAPLYIMAFLAGASTFAAIERFALQDAGAAVRVLLFLGAIFAGLRFAASRRHRIGLVDFNEAPATTQRLGLHT